MSYCPTHGSFDDYFNRGCPTCRAAEERAEADREEMLNSLSEIRHTRNLGDYVCPHCKQTSLKAGASRCPLCRGQIGDAYWNAVSVREKAEAERKAAALEAAAERKRAMEAAAEAELIRTAPERAAAARAAASAAASAAAERAVILGVKRFFACAAGILVGGFAGFVLAMILGIPLVFICAAMGNEGAANTIMTGIIVIGAIFGGVVGVILVEK